MKTAASRLRKGRVYEICYCCKTPGPDIEEGLITAAWLGEIDTWGKRTFYPLHGGEVLYLFDHELISVDTL
jgi:hypothetical protein